MSVVEIRRIVLGKDGKRRKPRPGRNSFSLRKRYRFMRKSEGAAMILHNYPIFQASTIMLTIYFHASLVISVLRCIFLRIPNTFYLII